MKRDDFVKILEQHGVIYDHHGKRHDIFIHIETGKKIPIPRHKEMKNRFMRRVLDEIPDKPPLIPEHVDCA